MVLGSEKEITMDLLLWINTIIILAIVAPTLVLVVYEARKTSEAFREVSNTLRGVSDALSRNERLTLATLDRLTPSQDPQA